MGLLQRKASISAKFAQVYQLNTRKIKQNLAKSLKSVAELKEFRSELRDEEEQKKQSLEDELAEAEDSLKDKVEAVAKGIYGADGVDWTKEALGDLRRLRKLGYAGLPVCMSKTQNSLSDDPSRRGRPTGFRITVRELQVAAGAGFVVVLTGDLLRMPGLPRVPQSENVDVVDGQIQGIG